MRKTLTILATFVIAFAIGIGSTVLLAGPADAAKPPVVCRLTVEPFQYCVDHPSCKNGTQRCWECQGYDLGGEPCLCTFLGCQ